MVCRCCGKAKPIVREGLCLGCLEFAGKTFYEPRFALVRDLLSEDYQREFDLLSEDEKKLLVQAAIEQGLII